MSKDLINSHINHDEFVSLNNLLRQYNDMEKAIKNPKSINSDNM